MSTQALKPLAFPPIVSTLLLLGIVLNARLAATSAEPAAQSVRLVVDYGDGVQVHFTSLAWRDGMTALNALNAAKAHAHGITFVQKGSGSGALITQIGDLKNQGGAETARNWLFYLNDKASDLGAGSQRLKAGDTVLWKFAVYSYN